MLVDHRQRILAAVRHEPVDKLPTDMMAEPEVLEMLFEHFQVDPGPAASPQGVGLISSDSRVGRLWITTRAAHQSQTV
jgi:hypothetical protein